MESNRSLVAKADAALSDLTTGGGALQPAQASKFIRTMIAKAKLSGLITVEPLDAPTQLIEKVRFSGQVLQPGTPGVALSLAERSAPVFGKDQWDAQFFKSEVRLPHAVLEQSIERGNLKATIMDALSEAVGRDAEKVIIQGDTTSSDLLLKKLNGILKQATSNTVDGGSARLDSDLMDAMLRALPTEFESEIEAMSFFTTKNAQMDYTKELRTRATALGDQVMYDGKRRPLFEGLPVDNIPMWPKTLWSGANETNILLTHPKNIGYGIWKKITVRTGEDVSAGVVIIVVETWFDVLFYEETAVVKGYDVLNS